MNPIITTSVFLCCTYSLVRAQTPTSTDTLYTEQGNSTIVKERQNIFRRTAQDVSLMVGVTAKSYARPFHWKKKEWILFGGTLAALLAEAVLQKG